MGACRGRCGRDAGLRERRLRTGRPCLAGGRRDGCRCAGAARRGRRSRRRAPGRDRGCARQVGQPHRRAVLRLGRGPDRPRLRGAGEHPGRCRGRGRPGRHVPRGRPAVPRAPGRVPGRRRRRRWRPSRARVGRAPRRARGQRLRRRQRPLDRPARRPSRRPDRRAGSASRVPAPLFRPAGGRRAPGARRGDCAGGPLDPRRDRCRSRWPARCGLRPDVRRVSAAGRSCVAAVRRRTAAVADRLGRRLAGRPARLDGGREPRGTCGGTRLDRPPRSRRAPEPRARTG